MNQSYWLLKIPLNTKILERECVGIARYSTLATLGYSNKSVSKVTLDYAFCIVHFSTGAQRSTIPIINNGPYNQWRFYHAASRGICPGSARHFFWLQAQYFFISLKKQIKFKKKERGKRKKETESFRLSESSSGQFLQLPPSPPPPSSSPLCLLFPPSPTPSISSSPRRRRRLLFHNPIAAAGKVS